MSSDFIGMKVIWPPDGTSPPKHEHDIIFVHGLHGGSVSDWRDENGVCWPAEHLPLDVGNARVLSFGYEHTKLNVKSDGFYEGGVFLKQGRDFCFALKAARGSDKVQVPLTLVGHGTGGILIQSALCFSHLGQDCEFLVKKARHVIFLGTPQTDLTWETWKQMSNGSSSAESKGRWKVWSSALGGSRKAFSEIAHRFTITSATVEGTAATNSTFADMGHGGPLMIEGVDHKTISKLLRGSDNYEKLATRIRANMRQTITHSTQIRRIQTWLGRRSDEINLDNYQRNLDKHHPGTAQWLFQDSRFRGWVASGISNSILWLVGPEGCGKSVLCSLAAKRMRQSAQRPAVVYLFLAFDQPRSEYHLATQIVLQLLNHVVEYQGGVDPEVFSALENQDSSKKLSGIYDLVRILISQCSAVYVFLDGLDEVGSVEKPGKRPQEDDKLDYVKKQLRSTLLFVASLAKSEYRTPVRLWCSSRHTPTINKWMRDMGALELQVNKQAVGADVTQYLNHHVKKSTVEAVSGSYGPEALQQVRTTAGSNFLVVSTLRSMESYTRLPLSNPRTKLSELYQERLDHLCATNSLSIRIISLVAFAKRPLMLKEVQEALAVSRKAFHDRFVVDLNTNDIQLLDGKIIQQDCTPFINVSQLDDGSHSGYLRLSHASIYYFLHGLSQSPISAIGQVHVGPNLLAEVCLKYLFQKRYENTHEDSVQDQSFLGYAAKYWHQHVDETDLDSVLLQISSSFLKSPQFLTLTRYQSLFLDRHFHYTFGDDESETKSQTVNVPQRLSTCADTKSLVKDYQYFVREWGGFLELGTTNSVASGAIEHCFWGALGKHNFLEVQGTLVEKNRSFILEMDTPGGEEEGNDVTSDYCFYERISDDGSRVAVWRMPAQPESGDQPPSTDHAVLLRESWYIGGHEAPSRYGSQETLGIDKQLTDWDWYNSSLEQKFTLIPILDASSRVPVLDEFTYGSAVRVGRRTFQRERGGVWTDDQHKGIRNTPYWENVTCRGPWVVRSRRKQIYPDAETSHQDSLPQDDGDRTSEPKASSDDGTLNTDKISGKVQKLGQDEDPVKDTDHEPSASEIEADQEVESDSDSGSSQLAASTPEVKLAPLATISSPISSSETDEPSDPESTVSSAEEFCMFSSSDCKTPKEGSDEEAWISSENDEDADSDESEAVEKDNHNEKPSKSTPDPTPKRSNKRTVKSAGLATQESHKIPLAEEDSDADDESSESGSVYDATSSSGSEDSDDENSATRSTTSSTTSSKSSASPEPDLSPPHSWSWGQYCNLCSNHVISSEYKDLDIKSQTFYQCKPCGADNVFDLCSACFDKGAWCKDDSHLFSKATFYFEQRKYYWEDGVSQQTAMPLVQIVAECRDSQDTGECDRNGDGHSRPQNVFRYTHRHESMLHDSDPIIHPTRPLLIYPLDGLTFLFANLQENSYFLFTIPFSISETAETGGSKCIPISTSLRFSPCGKYLYVMRFTARNDSAMLGPIRLSATVLTVKLSTRDPCSGNPRLLDSRTIVDLGPAKSRLVKKLPYTVTWTDEFVYVSMSEHFVTVFRFTLTAGEGIAARGGEPHKDVGSGVYLFAPVIPLPHSALSRAVHFFPSSGSTPARIILGSLLETRPQPPIVVYLKATHSDAWVLEKQRDFRKLPSLNSLSLRADPSIEEPYVSDDRDLVATTSTPSHALTMEPYLGCGLREFLETGFKRKGIHCPCCFELGLRLPFLRPPPYFPRFAVDRASVPDDARFKLEWRVRTQTLAQALKAGCQFCCYVASRLLGFKHIRITSQSIGSHGTRCCSKGSMTLDENRDTVQQVLKNLGKFEYKRKSDEGWLVFDCEPLNQDFNTRRFNKLGITMPGTTVGGKGEDARFGPTMVMFKGTNESGETQTVTSFFHAAEAAHGMPECVLELYSLPDDAAHQFIETRPLTTSRGSDENIGVIKSWLDDCQSNHAFCMQHANTKADLPTRLVEIIDLDTARLVETAGQVGEYVALSYCWGPNPDDNSMTTRSNLSERLQPHSLLRNELPGAIRDAIAIVERLGIRYIWIDAICMVQDDFNDKNFELGKMSQYYRNSYMTIAVSTTRCTTGFIGTLGRCEKHPKSPLPRDLIPLDVFALSMTKDEGQSGKVYVREENPYRLSEEPINKRAWTLQEGVLAPRVLLFGSRVIWFCQHMTHSDGGVEDWSFDETELERTRREFQVELSKLDREGSSKGAHASTATDANNTRDIYGLWHRIVGSYSRRDVSHPSDKLPAISAIAAEFSRLSNDDYLAGLWRSNLARDLLWRTPQPETHRPPQWRAPSWSWASVDDAIIYDEVPPPTATLLAEVLDVETVPLTTTVPFGEVSQGRLVISALSWRMKFSGDEDREHMSAPFLKAFGFNPGTSEREMLLEALKLYSRPEWKESEDEKKKFQLPDDFVVVLIYGLRDELAEFDDTDGDGETEGEGKTQLWTTWGLILKPTGVGEGDEELFERVMSFWQVPVRMEGPDPLPRRTLHII